MWVVTLSLEVIEANILFDFFGIHGTYQLNAGSSAMFLVATYSVASTRFHSFKYFNFTHWSDQSYIAIEILILHLYDGAFVVYL